MITKQTNMIYEGSAIILSGVAVLYDAVRASHIDVIVRAFTGKVVVSKSFSIDNTRTGYNVHIEKFSTPPKCNSVSLEITSSTGVNMIYEASVLSLTEVVP